MKNNNRLMPTIVVCLFFIIFSCASKNMKMDKNMTSDEVIYESILKVPLKGKLGVSIYIDSLGFFNHNSQNLDNKINSEKIEKQINEINKDFDIEKIITNRIVKILDDNHYDYEILDVNVQNKIIKDNLKQVNFDDLRKKSKTDNLLIINLKSGLDYNPENKNKYIGKTYMYINILDLKNNKLKYTETIGGTKFIEKDINTMSTNELGKIIKESVDETIKIIDSKY